MRGPEHYKIYGDRLLVNGRELDELQKSGLMPYLESLGTTKGISVFRANNASYLDQIEKCLQDSGFVNETP